MIRFLVVALVALASFAVQAACPWPDPGANPYTGDKAEAVRRMHWIPSEIRAELAQAVNDRTYSAQAEVRKDGIYVNSQKSREWHGLANMNFGANGHICHGKTDVSMWPRGRTVGALIYSHRGHTVAVISECGNVAQVIDSRAALAAVSGATPGPVRPVPEPGMLALLAIAGVALALVRRP